MDVWAGQLMWLGTYWIGQKEMTKGKNTRSRRLFFFVCFGSYIFLLVFLKKIVSNTMTVFVMKKMMDGKVYALNLKIVGLQS
jgi:hypothetical protein